METDPENKYRTLFDSVFNDFPDRVDNPWERTIPDLPEFNGEAYRQIERQLTSLQRDKSHKSRGLLILGAAGTGKTHLLMRVARKLSTFQTGTDSLKSHILFVRRPNNEEAVAQHIWDNIVISLGQSLNDDQERSQLDTMLAHVFSAVLIPEFEQDIADGNDTDQKRRWKTKLEKDPYNLLNMLGDGDQHLKNLRFIRNRTLKHLQDKQAEVDQDIARVLITYCLVRDKNRRRLLLEWLRGKEIEPQKVRELGLPGMTWSNSDETSGDAAVQQERERFALKAIQTIGHLSTYYRPLVLAFDQLEGLRGKDLLTSNWGDTVREIFTMTPNLLILTCIFPDLWENWFSPTLDTSASERISQTKIILEPFSCQFGMEFLKVYMEPWFQEFHLPNPIYPFTPESIETICADTVSPRQFLQQVNTQLRDWFWSKSESTTTIPVSQSQSEQESIDIFIGQFIGKTFAKFKDKHTVEWHHSIPIENDYFGRINAVLDAVIELFPRIESRPKATCERRVMPLNRVLRDMDNHSTVCFGVLNSGSNSFTSRMKNLISVFQRGDQFTRSVIFRDQRCTEGFGAACRESVNSFEKNGGEFVELDQEEVTLINAIYDTLIAIEEHDMALGSHEVSKGAFIDYLFTRVDLDKYKFFYTIFALLPSLKKKTTVLSGESNDLSGIKPPKQETTENPNQENSSRTSSSTSAASTPPPFSAEIVIGNKKLDITQSGVLGTLKERRKKVAFSFSKPMCTMVVGYMGSGKSYALGVLIENALMNIDNLVWNPRPTCVVAFNYRRNAESRFEYGSYTQPNNKNEEVRRLADEYNATPRGIEKLNVLAFGPELERRKHEYGNAALYPIQFLPHELSVAHWEILMKPPTPNAEYMNIARHIIQELFYSNRLTFDNLERTVEDDERLSNAQKQRIYNRLRFARTWITDHRDYEWSDILSAGTLSIFDLRMQALPKEDALRLCLIITDIVRSTKNGINKTIIFDEAHEYVDSRELVGELENAITQIRHEGLSFILASQFPQRIPQDILKYLQTRMIFQIADQKAINYLRGSAPNLSNLSPYQVSNLNTESGECFLQSDNDCSDEILRKPQLFIVRPRCSLHGGATKRS